MLRWFDGFEHYGSIGHMTEGIGGGAAWSQVDTGWTLSTADPATGDYHMRLTEAGTGSRLLRRIFGQAKQVFGIGYRFQVDELPACETGGALVLADIRDVSNGSHFTIVMGTDGSVFAMRGADVTTPALGGTLIGRSDPCIAPGGYHHFELKGKIDNSTGYIEVRINQVTVLNLTGKDTQNTANAAAAQFAVGEAGAGISATAPAYGIFDLDDPFVWDVDATDPENTVVDFVGDKGVYWLPADADTATSDFALTGSVTAHGALSSVPPDPAKYLSTASTTARTIVGVAGLPGNIAEVIAFMPVINGRKEESGAVTLRGGIVSNGQETYGPDDDPSTADAYMRPGPKTIDPDTGVPWANDAEPELLIERTA